MITKIFKWVFYLIGIPLAILIILIGSIWLKYQYVVNQEPGQMMVAVQPGELGKWVNPFIGTGGIPWVCGNNFPGATMPFGMVRLSPDTEAMIIDKPALNNSGYYFGDNKILGFSHTRLAGTGATDGGHFRVLPMIETIDAYDWNKKPTDDFSHDNEIAFPGYYAVKLDNSEILAELTASTRVGVHRYSFPQHAVPNLLLEVTSTLGDRRSEDGYVRIDPQTNELQGHVRTFGTFASRYGGQKVYFVARLNKPITGFGIWDKSRYTANLFEASGEKLAVSLIFDSDKKNTCIEMKLAISYVSLENARLNLETESAALNFDQVCLQAKDAWEEKLSTVKNIKGHEKQKVIFYTALYHALQMPTIFTDVDGRYLGFDKQIHKAEGFQYYTDLSLWDTFRTVHPLYTILYPKEQRDMIVSLIEMGKQGGGWLPRWPSGSGYTNSMLSTPADIVISESWQKGIRDFDIKTAYEMMRRTALEPIAKNAPFSGREGIEYYLKYGYCPADLMNEAVSRTLEFNWSDDALSRLAAQRGYAADAETFYTHSQFYRNLWNPQTQYFQPRNADGSFFEPFKPLLLTYLDGDDEFTNDYVEGSALQWRWGVPFDPQGLIGLFKSKDYFISELNDFFALSDSAMGNWNPGSYYWHGNQPDIYAAYLFNDAGRPDLTQKWVRWIMRNKYGTGYDGLDGNDDGGTLSAWYVLSALGIYPMAGTDKYQIGSPLFAHAELFFADTTLHINAEKNGPKNVFVQSTGLNGDVLKKHWLSHKEIVSGGELKFTMTGKPISNRQNQQESLK